MTPPKRNSGNFRKTIERRIAAGNFPRPRTANPGISPAAQGRLPEGNGHRSPADRYPSVRWPDEVKRTGWLTSRLRLTPNRRAERLVAGPRRASEPCRWPPPPAMIVVTLVYLEFAWSGKPGYPQ